MVLIAPFLIVSLSKLEKPHVESVKLIMSPPAPLFGPCPPRFAEIKKDIANSYPDFHERVTAAWNDLLGELDKVTQEVARQGSQVCSFFSGRSRRNGLVDYIVR